MARISKRKQAAREKVDSAKAYIIEEALGLVKELATAKFPESIDVSVNLGVDPRKSDQVVRGSTVLPNGTGKSVRVAVFAQGPAAEAAADLRPLRIEGRDREQVGHVQLLDDLDRLLDLVLDQVEALDIDRADRAGVDASGLILELGR